MAASRVPAAIDAIVALLAAAVGATAVTDGPQLAGDIPPVLVCVGYDGAPDSDMHAISNWTRVWAGLGAQKQNEAFDVDCCVIGFAGDTDVKTRRDAVFATFALAEAALRAQIDLGLPSPTVTRIAYGGYFQEQTDRGLQTRIPFSVNVQTRI